MSVEVFLSRILLLMVLATLFTGCISSHEVTEDYQEKIPVQFQTPRKRTILLIVVDGLGANMLAENFDSIPQIQNYFGVTAHSFPLAHSTFPSLTFPNMTSLLTLSPVNQHSVVGNKMLLPQPHRRTPRLLNFETRGDLIWLNQIKEESLVYSQLHKKGRLSVSFAQSLFAGATAGNPGDLPMGASYLKKDYYAIDRRNIKALDILLRDTNPSEWPDFLFLHLISIDGLAHDLGPSSPKISEYLKKLDSELASVLRRLNSAQNNGHYIASILTADHGFIEVAKTSILAQQIESKLQNIEIINQGRVLSLYFNEGKIDSPSLPYLRSLAHRSEVDLVAFINNNTIEIVTKHADWTFPLQRDLTCSPYGVSVRYQYRDVCPDELEKAIGPFILPPFAFKNLISYFSSPRRPDSVIVATEGVSFSPESKGQHGGLSQQETLVPLLVKGISIRNNRTPGIYELLKVVFQ